MFSNRTPADGGGTDGAFTDRLGVNPLKGMLYECNHMTPRLHDHMDMSTAMRDAFQDEDAEGIDKLTSADAADSHLFHPLGSKFWLKNCVKESKILLQPGQAKGHSTTKLVKGKISSIIERIYYSGFDKGNFGSCSIFMFDMVHKSTETPTTTYKRMCLVQSAGKLVQPKLYIPDYEAVTFNL
jgi:hypothetical protein